MSKSNHKSNAIKLGITLGLLALIFFGMRDKLNKEDYFVATYIIESDYSKEDLPSIMKNKLSLSSKQNRKIYKIVQSSALSFEMVDSIAHKCGGESIMIKPEVIIREKGLESVDYYYNTVNVQKRYSVQEPKYLDNWEISGPVAYQNSKDRYFRAVKENTNDYIIFDSMKPVSNNIMLIRGIDGLVVEALIGVNRIVLHESSTMSSSKLSSQIRQFQEVHRVNVRLEDHIDFSLLIGSHAELTSSEDFICVESL